MRINAYITVEGHGDQAVLRCRCDHLLGPASEGYKRRSLESRRPIQAAGSRSNPYGLGGDRFELREYACPSCQVLYEVEVALRGDPVLDDVLIDA